jgi:hypothetical protein
VGEVRRGKAEIADVTGEHLRWSEVEEMVASGVFEAHSHSHSHVRWHKIYSDTAEHLRVLEEDLAASYQMLKARFGSDGPRHLAWPWGFSMPDTRAVAQSMGFGFQYTVKNNFNTRATPLNQINRLCMDGKSLGEFAARLEFFRNPLLRQLYPPVLHQFDWMKRLVKGR